MYNFQLSYRIYSDKNEHRMTLRQTISGHAPSFYMRQTIQRKNALPGHPAVDGVVFYCANARSSSGEGTPV